MEIEMADVGCWRGRGVVLREIEIPPFGEVIWEIGNVRRSVVITAPRFSISFVRGRVYAARLTRVYPIRSRPSRVLGQAPRSHLPPHILSFPSTPSRRHTRSDPPILLHSERPRSRAAGAWLQQAGMSHAKQVQASMRVSEKGVCVGQGEVRCDCRAEKAKGKRARRRGTR